MSFTTKKTKLSSKLKALDNQCPIDKNPLVHRDGVIWLLIGRKGSSKSTTMLNALNTPIRDGGYKNYYDKIFIISPNMEHDGKASRLVEEVQEKNNYFPELDNASLQKILSQIEDNDGERYLLILDDCIHSMPKTSQKGSLFNYVITTARHLHLDIWISSQKLKMLNPLVRNNVDMVSIWRTDSSSEKKSLEEEFSFTDDIFDYAVDEPYSFLHITYTGGCPIFFKKFDRIT